VNPADRTAAFPCLPGQPDAIAMIDADPASPGYGTVTGLAGLRDTPAHPGERAGLTARGSGAAEGSPTAAVVGNGPRRPAGRDRAEAPVLLSHAAPGTQTPPGAQITASRAFLQPARRAPGEWCRRLLAPPSLRHWLVISLALAAYTALAVAVITTSPLVGLDWQVKLFRPHLHWPAWRPWLSAYVILGQRMPSAVLALSWLAFRSRRTHTIRPVLVGVMALGLLNLSVGSAKLGFGRLGPGYARHLGSSELFHGGNVFPSGHTANAVVTWGVVAYLATRYRRTGIVLAVVMAVTIGATTVLAGEPAGRVPG
jgi:membrane-associated phospholipid phosphatase